MREIKISVKNIAINALFVALALIFSYIERLFPFNVGIVGIKLGVTNIVVLTALYTIGTANAFFINIIRIALVSLLFGTASSLIYSACGGMLSFFVMWIVKKIKSVSIVGVSILGGVFHNIGQLIGVIFVIGNVNFGYLLPVLIIAGCITGLVIGLVSLKIVSVIKNYKRG